MNYYCMVVGKSLTTCIPVDADHLLMQMAHIRCLTAATYKIHVRIHALLVDLFTMHNG